VTVEVSSRPATARLGLYFPMQKLVLRHILLI